MNRLVAQHGSGGVPGVETRAGDGSGTEARTLASVDDQIESLLAGVRAEFSMQRPGAVSMQRPAAAVPSTGQRSARRPSPTSRLRFYLGSYDRWSLVRIVLYLALAVVCGILSVYITSLGS